MTILSYSLEQARALFCSCRNGVEISPEGAEFFAKFLATAVELATELEAKVERLEAERALDRFGIRPIPEGGNVVRLPLRPRPVRPLQPNDGGAA